MSKRYVITVTDDLAAKLEHTAKQAGIHPLEYWRYLLMKDVMEDKK